MKRRLLFLLANVFLLLCGAAVFERIFGWRMDGLINEVRVERLHSRYSIRPSNGQLVILIINLDTVKVPPSDSVKPYSAYGHQTNRTFAGADIQSFLMTYTLESGAELDHLSYRTIFIDLRMIATLAGVIAAVCFWRYRRALQKDRRRKMGQCPACGYDMRATPDRCPECGTVVVAQVAAK